MKSTAEMYREKFDTTFEVCSNLALTRYPTEQEIQDEVKRLEHNNPGFKVKQFFLP